MEINPNRKPSVTREKQHKRKNIIPPFTQISAQFGAQSVTYSDFSESIKKDAQPHFQSPHESECQLASFGVAPEAPTGLV